MSTEGKKIEDQQFSLDSDVGRLLEWMRDSGKALIDKDELDSLRVIAMLSSTLLIGQLENRSIVVTKEDYGSDVDEDKMKEIKLTLRKMGRLIHKKSWPNSNELDNLDNLPLPTFNLDK